jgi:hypothetical protein
MTTDGGTTSDDNTNLDDTKWDGARIVLARVADVFREHEIGTVTAEILEAEVENYYLLPDLTRETFGNLTPAEQAAVTKVIQNLASDHFYIEGGPGGLHFY